MIDPDRDEKLCEAVTPGELHGVSLASARGGILWCMFLGYPMNYDQQIASFALERDAVYFKEARTLLPEYIEEVRRLREWQKKAVKYLGDFLDFDEEGLIVLSVNTAAEIRRLIE